MLNILDLLAICSLLTNILMLILSYLSYKESRCHTILISHPIFAYEICTITIHFDNIYISHTILIVYYIS